MKKQPIETAPKDRPILLFPSRYNDYPCDIGKWRERDGKRKSFWERCGVTSVYENINCPPTHWMEIPTGE